MIVVFLFIVTVLEGNQFISSYIYVKPYICLVLFFLLLQSYITDQALFFICVFCIAVKAVSQITHWVITSLSLNIQYCIVLYCIGFGLFALIVITLAIYDCKHEQGYRGLKPPSNILQPDQLLVRSSQWTLVINPLVIVPSTLVT